jgi:hypothetical protein
LPAEFHETLATLLRDLGYNVQTKH